MTTELERPITFTPRGAAPVNWTTLEEVKDWVDREVAAWRPLAGTGVTGQADEWRVEIWQPIKDAQEALSVDLLTQTAGQRSASLSAQNELDTLVTQYTHGPLINSTSPDGEAILARFHSGDELGAIIEAGIRVNQRSIFLSSPGGRGAIDARLFFTEIAKAVLWDAVERQQLENYRASHDTIISEFGKKLNATIEQFETANQALQLAHSKIEADIEHAKTLERRLGRSAISGMKRARAEFDALKNTYKTEIALKTPGSYWRRRANWSSAAWIVALTMFVVGACALGYFLTEHAGALKKWLTDADGKVDIGAVLLLSPAVVLVLWFFRMIARLQSVGVTESVDAGQRRVMLSTFLALTNDPNAHLTEAEQFLILQALFRASGGKDEPDGMPASALEALVKAIQGRN